VTGHRQTPSTSGILAALSAAIILSMIGASEQAAAESCKISDWRQHGTRRSIDAAASYSHHHSASECKFPSWWYSGRTARSARGARVSAASGSSE
jgi:hypothetical protein